MEKVGYIKYFGEGCVEWFVKEMRYMKNYFKNELEIILDKIPESLDQNASLLCEKEFKLKDVEENPVC